MSLIFQSFNPPKSLFSLHVIFLAENFPKNKSSRRFSSLEHNFPGKIFSLHLIFQGNDHPMIFSSGVLFPPNCQVKTNIPKIRLHKELDNFLPFLPFFKNGQNRKGTISSHFPNMVRMGQGQFPPIFKKWSERHRDNFLQFFKNVQNGVGTIYSYFPKMVRMEKGQFPPIFLKCS